MSTISFLSYDIFIMTITTRIFITKVFMIINYIKTQESDPNKVD